MQTKELTNLNELNILKKKWFLLQNPPSTGGQLGPSQLPQPGAEKEIGNLRDTRDHDHRNRELQYNTLFMSFDIIINYGHEKQQTVLIYDRKSYIS